MAGGMRVQTISLIHPGGAIGYRLEHDGASVAYMSDTAPFASPGAGVLAGKEPPRTERRVIDFLRGCDCVVYDTMYDLSEYLQKMTWGHSYPEYAVGLCAAAGVRHVILFHHLPDASDDDLDALEAHWSSHRSPRVTVAREGDTVRVGGA
jgi:ribonuclease BN (tRNA processing enzyme)